MGLSAAPSILALTPEDLFNRHPLLGALEASDRRQLLQRAQVRSFRAEQTIFRKDDVGDGLYGVMSGRVVITVESSSGKELILNTFGPGAFFGEIALLDGKASPRGEMYFYRGRELFAVRKGPWKAHFLTQPGYGAGRREVHDPPLLFQLDVDPSETTNVAADHAEVLREITSLAAEHRKSVVPAASQLEIPLPATSRSTTSR